MSHRSTVAAPFLCMFLLACCISQAVTTESDDPDAYFRFKYKVHIINGFADNAAPLLLRCHSNDDNLGEHTLWKDQEFQFKFGLHWVKTTHFVCDFERGSKYSLSGITVFMVGVETSTCLDTGNCFWRAEEGGIYFSNDNRSWKKWYFWP